MPAIFRRQPFCMVILSLKTRHSERRRETWRYMPQCNKSWALLSALFCALMASAPARAALLSGTVHDPQNRAISGATVSLMEKAKGVIRRSESDDAGRFLFPSVEPGVYTVVVNKSG